LPSQKTDEVIRINPNPFHDSIPGKAETALEQGALKDMEEPVHEVGRRGEDPFINMDIVPEITELRLLHNYRI
jgi:hypothetical protein